MRESEPESFGWWAVHPARFWLIAFGGVMVVICGGTLARVHLGLSFSAVAVFGAFMSTSAIALPIHIRWWLLRVRCPQVGQALRNALDPQTVRLHHDVVQCHGSASRARAIRGYGALVMTDDSLIFRPCIGDGDIEIDLDAVVAVDVTREHMGAVRRHDLLRVVLSEGQDEDTVAWEFPDPGAWLETLQARSSELGG